MPMVFLEVILDAQDLEAHGLLSRDEIEDPLAAVLEASGLGEVTGGGGGTGRYVVDVEVSEPRFDEALATIRAALLDAGAPSSTIIRRHHPREESFRLVK